MECWGVFEVNCECFFFLSVFFYVFAYKLTLNIDEAVKKANGWQIKECGQVLQANFEYFLPHISSPLIVMKRSKRRMGGSLRNADRSLRPTLKGLRSSSCRCMWMCRRRSIFISRHSGSSKCCQCRYDSIYMYMVGT